MTCFVVSFTRLFVPHKLVHSTPQHVICGIRPRSTRNSGASSSITRSTGPPQCHCIAPRLASPSAFASQTPRFARLLFPLPTPGFAWCAVPAPCFASSASHPGPSGHLPFGRLPSGRGSTGLPACHRLNASRCALCAPPRGSRSSIHSSSHIALYSARQHRAIHSLGSFLASLIGSLCVSSLRDVLPPPVVSCLRPSQPYPRSSERLPVPKARHSFRRKDVMRASPAAFGLYFADFVESLFLSLFRERFTFKLPNKSRLFKTNILLEIHINLNIITNSITYQLLRGLYLLARNLIKLIIL